MDNENLGLVYVPPGYGLAVIDLRVGRARAVFSSYFQSLIFKIIQPSGFWNFEIVHVYIGPGWVSVVGAKEESRAQFKSRVLLAGNPRPKGEKENTFASVIIEALTKGGKKHEDMHKSSSSN